MRCEPGLAELIGGSLVRSHRNVGRAPVPMATKTVRWWRLLYPLEGLFDRTAEIDMPGERVHLFAVHEHLNRCHGRKGGCKSIYPGGYRENLTGWTPR